MLGAQQQKTPHCGVFRLASGVNGLPKNWATACGADQSRVLLTLPADAVP